MLDEKISAGLNAQLNAEIYSAHLYYSMSAYFEGLSLKGFSHWLRIQALEESTHVQKFFAYLHERGGRAVIGGVEAPPCEWTSPLATFEAVYAHEVDVSGMVNRLMTMAQSIDDHATANFLQWFVGEQVEEEAMADEIVQRLKLVNQSEGGLFLLDQEMDKRTLAIPPEIVAAF